MFQRDVARGIHRLTVAHTNVYLVEQDDRVLIVDAGLPAFWRPLVDALARLGRSPGDVDGLVLTHGHFDHVGIARRIRREWGVPVCVDPADARLAAHPYSYRHERNRLLIPLTHPASLRPLAAMTRAGALMVKGIGDVSVLSASTPLPGSPVVLSTPGHTDGHVALHFPDRGAVIVGDAIVTLDPYTGVTGPQIVSGAATADSPLALRSLDALVGTRASTVLTGHGEPWRDGIASAVGEARARGAH